MPFNGSGSYTPPGANFPVVANTLITSADFNATVNDIATALSLCITKDGQQTVTANIPFNTKRLTGVAAASARTDAAQYAQVQNSAAQYIGTVAGTNTITGQLTPTLTAYAAGQLFWLIPANTNTGATTVNIDAVGAKNIFANGAALTGGELVAGLGFGLLYDGTQFNIINSTPAVVKLDSGIASAAASVSFTGLTSAYSRYDIELENVLSSSYNDTLLCRVSAASSFISSPTYDWAHQFINDGGTPADAGGAGTTAMHVMTGFGTGANESGSVIASLINPSAARWPRVTWSGGVENLTPRFNAFTGGGQQQGLAANDRIQFLFTTGTITAQYTLWGYLA